MTRGSSRNLLEKQRKQRQDLVSTSAESDGDNSPRVQYPRGRIGKKKVDEVSPRRRGKRTANRQRPNGRIRIEEPSSSPPPTRSTRRACDAQRPNHEAAVGAIRLYTKPVLTVAIGHETPRKVVDYLKNMSRARTDLQVDWYNSLFLGRKKSSIMEMKWIDWDFMQKQSNQVAKTAVNLCHQKNIDALMSMAYNWSEELIGQFYASAYFEDSDDGLEEQVRWLTEGIEYSITISQFASIFGLNAVDLSKADLHLQPALSQETIKRLYVDDSTKVTLGTVKGLLPHFDLLLKMIKTTLSPKSGNKIALTARHAALLWSMRASAPPFSVMKYIWNEIQEIVLDPSKGLAYAPFLHQMIQRGIRTTSSSSSSPITIALSAIFGLCKKNAMKIKSNERKINQILRDSSHEIPQESEDEDYIDPFVAYEAELAARAAGASSSRTPQDDDNDEDDDDEDDNDDDDADDDEE
uniref:Uncharacterized protein n=1 Tax=Oryza brachyantha TaxID=4533 RepID=J3LWQ2_ORYBR